MNPIKSCLISLITEHKVEIEVIPEFYLFSFPYLLGRESLVLEGFPADLSIKLLDLFMLEQAKSFQTLKNLNLVFFGDNSRTISKIASLKPPILTPMIPGSPLIELTAQNLEFLLGAGSSRDISNFKDFSVTLVLFLISEMISNLIFPPEWQIIVVSRGKFESPFNNMSIDFLKIAKNDEEIKIDRFKSKLSNQFIKTDTKNNFHESEKEKNEITETVLSARMICKKSGHAIDINDVLLPSMIYVLLGENVIMHTYTEMDFIHLVAILACENESKQINIGKLYICINNSEDRKNLSSFVPSLELSGSNLTEKTEEGSCENFLIESHQLHSLKFSENIHGLIAILSSVPKDLTIALANIPIGFNLLLGTACYCSDLLHIMPKSRFILLSGYPIRPLRCVGYKSEEYKLINLSPLPTIDPKPPHKPKSTKSKVKSKQEPMSSLPVDNSLRLEDHASFLLTSLLQSNCNILISCLSYFDTHAIVEHIISRVDLKSKNLQVIIHGDVPSINIVFEKFSVANRLTNCAAFYFAGGVPSSLNVLLISDKIQILFIPTNELIITLHTTPITTNCRVLLGLYIGNSTPCQSLSSLHRQIGLNTQIVLVSRVELDSNTDLIPKPFYLLQEGSHVGEKERFSVTYCNYSMSF